MREPKFKPDFWFDSPHKTSTKCTNPLFSVHNLHRIAIMKDYHAGSKGDIDENGLKGWVTKGVCTECGREFKNRKFVGFVTDKEQNKQPNE